MGSSRAGLAGPGGEVILRVSAPAGWLRHGPPPAPASRWPSVDGLGQGCARQPDRQEAGGEGVAGTRGVDDVDAGGAGTATVPAGSRARTPRDPTLTTTVATCSASTSRASCGSSRPARTAASSSFASRRSNWGSRSRKNGRLARRGAAEAGSRLRVAPTSTARRERGEADAAGGRVEQRVAGEVHVRRPRVMRARDRCASSIARWRPSRGTSCARGDGRR